MLIGEVSRITGLTRKAINIYEKKGLIKPIRGANRYREYSEFDIKILKDISFYRSLEISISEIRQIINNSDKEEIINKILLEKKNRKELLFERQRKYLCDIKNNDLKACEMQSDGEDSRNIEVNYKEINNISIDLNKTKEALKLCLNYITKIGKLDELIVITQCSARDLMNIIDIGIMPANLASYIMDCINIDIQVLVGARQLTDLEKIFIDREIRGRSNEE